MTWHPFKVSLCTSVEEAKLAVDGKVVILAVAGIVVTLLLATFITGNFQSPSPETKEVPHESKWGIYLLDLETETTELVYSSAEKISRIRLNNAGDKLAFYHEVGNSSEPPVEGSPISPYEEICSINVDGANYRRLTYNEVSDLVPCWSADDSKIFFLSFRENMDIFVMDADGGNMQEVYDSGGHDSDLHASGGKLAFTRDSQIWIMNEDGTGLAQVTDPSRAGEWGNAVLPFGDYDPNLTTDGSRIVFERMDDDLTTHGNYNLYVINVDGSGETAVTDTGYTQGIAAWSHSGEQIVYMVSAIGNDGKYDLYMVDSDGTDSRDITPDYYPAELLCYEPIFSKDDSKVFFVGQWFLD